MDFNDVAKFNTQNSTDIYVYTENTEYGLYIIILKYQLCKITNKNTITLVYYLTQATL